MKFKEALLRESHDPDNVAALTHEAILHHGLEAFTHEFKLHDAFYHTLVNNEDHHYNLHAGLHNTLHSIGWQHTGGAGHHFDSYDNQRHYSHPAGNRLTVTSSPHEEYDPDVGDVHDEDGGQELVTVHMRHEKR